MKATTGIAALRPIVELIGLPPTAATIGHSLLTVDRRLAQSVLVRVDRDG